MDPRDEVSINHLKSLNLKTSFQHDITNRIKEATNDFTRNIFLPQLSDITVNYAVEMCREFKEKGGFITPAIRDYLCEEVCDAVEERTPEFWQIKNDVKKRVKFLI
jgi:polysaccharide pyruvyl transferase WcaK-like protein